jgi:hypothetical protein
MAKNTWSWFSGGVRKMWKEMTPKERDYFVGNLMLGASIPAGIATGHPEIMIPAVMAAPALYVVHQKIMKGKLRKVV